MYLKGDCAGIHVGQGQDVTGTEPPRGAKRIEEISLKSRDSFRVNIKSEQDIEQEVSMSFVPKLHQAHQE